MERTKGHRLPEIDALRGIAALSVVLFHITINRKEAQYGFNLGCVGVDLFFVISGFVILMTLHNCGSGKEFLLKRIVRLYPAYWICLTFTTLVIACVSWYRHTDTAGLWKIYLINTTMFQHYANVQDIDGSYWTLVVEWQFYLCMLLLFVSGMLKHVEYIGGIILALTGIVVAYPALQQIETIGRLFSECSVWTYFPLFLAGMLYYKAMHDGINIMRILFILICFSMQALLFNSSYRNSGFISFFQYCSMLCIIAGIFFLLISNTLTWIVSSLTIKLGVLSYCLYLVHQYISMHVLIPWMITSLKCSSAVAASSALLLVLMLALFIHICFEKPVQHFIRKKIAGDVGQ